MTIGKTIALTRQTFVSKVMSLLFNMLSRLVITFLPRSNQRINDVYIFFPVFFFWLCWVIIAMHRPSLVARGGYSLVVECELLIGVASLVLEHGLSCPWHVVSPALAG